ncbi:MAG: hypothetical protein ORN51_07135 [Akkermansiaceae bacterium]|nr:hypothetical protein [Akkermansiaceae bacterium]
MLKATLTYRLAAYCTAVVAALTSAIALSPQAFADHDTVGGGTWTVANSDSPCTVYRYGIQFYESCAGTWVTLPPDQSDYIVVPLGSHLSVTCSTYAPGGQLFESDTENLADVPDKQQYWATHGYGPYTPQAMCQLW